LSSAFMERRKLINVVAETGLVWLSRLERGKPDGS